MKRTIIIGAALAVLVGAGVAVAASFNNYTAVLGWSKGVGTPRNPVPVSFSQTLGASGTGGNRAAPLTRLTSTMYGIISNGRFFPTCSVARINAVKNDSGCPGGALVAQGPVTALLGAANAPTAAGTPCNPLLHVWNAGQGKLAFFFTIVPPNHTCGGLQTGSSAAYPGTFTQVGKNLILDVPLPPDISTKAGGLSGVYASLIHYTLVFRKQTTRVKGKAVGLLESVGCKGGSRPWSQKFTAQSFSGASGSSTVTGSTKC